MLLETVIVDFENTMSFGIKFKIDNITNNLSWIQSIEYYNSQLDMAKGFNTETVSNQELISHWINPL